MKTIIPNISIRAISSYLPAEILEMTELSVLFGENEVKSIIKATGIERVHIADENETSSDMCFNAAEYLIKKEGIELSSIDGLVFVSQTCDYILPSTSVILQERLGLSNETVCIDIHYGCSGYIYGIYQAALWINSKSCTNVLVLAGDTSSKLINPQDKSLKMVFGDCGTATLVTEGNFPMGISINSDGSGANSLIVPAGGFRLPANENTALLKYDKDNNGRTENDLFMDGMTVFNFAITNVHAQIDNLIEMMNWNKEDVDLYALHQANKFMVDYIRKKLKVDKEKVPVNVTNYGNTGPATIPLLLSDLNYNSDGLGKVILSGFGVGLSWGSIATNIQNSKFYILPK